MSENKVKWHPYPEEKPIFDDDYLITVKYKHLPNRVYICSGVNGLFNIKPDVIAWAELPEPYKEEQNA